MKMTETTKARLEMELNSVLDYAETIDDKSSAHYNNTIKNAAELYAIEAKGEDICLRDKHHKADHRTNFIDSITKNTALYVQLGVAAIIGIVCIAWETNGGIPTCETTKSTLRDLLKFRK